MTLNSYPSLVLDEKQSTLLDELKKIATELNKKKSLLDILNKKNLKSIIFYIYSIFRKILRRSLNYLVSNLFVNLGCNVGNSFFASL